MDDIEQLRTDNADLLREAQLSDGLSAALISVCNEAMTLLKRIGDAESLTHGDRQQCLAAFETWKQIVEQFDARLKISEAHNAATSDRAH